jgi:hypothetical protein
MLVARADEAIRIATLVQKASDCADPEATDKV